MCVLRNLFKAGLNNFISFERLFILGRVLNFFLLHKIIVFYLLVATIHTHRKTEKWDRAYGKMSLKIISSGVFASLGEHLLKSLCPSFCADIINSITRPVSGKFNPLNTELNPICHLLALLGAHLILHVSRIRVNVGEFLWKICRAVSVLYRYRTKVTATSHAFLCISQGNLTDICRSDRYF